MTKRCASSNQQRWAAEPLVPVSVGELYDRISILGLKVERLAGADQRRRAAEQLTMLADVRSAIDETDNERLSSIGRQLDEVNGRLWDVEQLLREHEASEDFGAEFVARARSVYQLNDLRAALKRQIDTFTGSRLTEQKSYATTRTLCEER